MINGVIAKGTLTANKNQSISLSAADPGYPIQVTIKLINVSLFPCVLSVYASNQNANSPSNGDALYNQYTLNANESLLIDVLTMSFNESIILLSSSSNVNYYITGVQSPA
jgi:hypothetical protein